ncbi:MAG: type II toxin-antitoxin system RelE/ParE family toxin [Beijerinckiaceae bacterium]
MSKDKEPLIRVIFYRTAGGSEPVRDWLRTLDAEDRHIIGLDLMRVQTQWPIGMPVCRALGQGLWEVRSSLTGGRIARVLFFISGHRIGAVHGFIKKTQGTPDDDLALARKRMKEMLT